jgi:hypothetical protein
MIDTDALHGDGMAAEAGHNGSHGSGTQGW